MKKPSSDDRGSTRSFLSDALDAFIKKISGPRVKQLGITEYIVKSISEKPPTSLKDSYPHLNRGIVIADVLKGSLYGRRDSMSGGLLLVWDREFKLTIAAGRHAITWRRNGVIYIGGNILEMVSWDIVRDAIRGTTEGRTERLLVPAGTTCFDCTYAPHEETGGGSVLAWRVDTVLRAAGIRIPEEPSRIAAPPPPKSGDR